MTVDSSTITSPPARPDDGGRGPVRIPRLIASIACRQPLALGARMSLAEVDEVVIGRGIERRWSRRGRQMVVSFADSEMSRVHARLVRRPDGWTLNDAGSKNGTLLNGVRLEVAPVADGDIIEVGGTFLIFRDRAEEGGDRGDRDLAAEEAVPDVFRTLSFDLERRAVDLVRVALSRLPVLVVGETGTGKELAARAIHDMSGRRGPFVAINCGALPRALVESELFGYRRGAFSEAREDRPGLARAADGGTLFLDEVAELAEESQVALLRLLQEGEVRPIGSTQVVKVNVRVVAATHQDLPGRIESGRFRRDLFARLAGHEMVIPALRQRREDIGALIAILLRRIGVDDPAFSIDRRAALGLLTYSYPMNVRELEQALRSAIVLATRAEIGLEQLPAALRAPIEPSGGGLPPEDAAIFSRLVALLRQHRGNVSATARALDKAPVQIRRWCRRFGIHLTEFRR